MQFYVDVYLLPPLSSIIVSTSFFDALLSAIDTPNYGCGSAKNITGSIFHKQETNPLGRLLNRLSSDMSNTDDALPWCAFVLFF